MLNRRNFLGLAAAGAATMALSRKTYSAEYSGPKPNFIVIMTDDQGYNDLGCFGSPDISTPNIDKMCVEGAKFTDFYAAAPLCSPSRAGLLTGCHPGRIGFAEIPDVIWNDTGLGLHWDEITIAKLLKTRGYATACVGKWHLGIEKPFLPTSHGFDSFYGIADTHDMASILMRNETVLSVGEDVTPLTKNFTDEALTFITAHQSEPFFLYLNPCMPHVPLAASAEFLGKSERGLYGDAVEEVDWGVGQVLQKLKDLGIDNNTCVVFTSDNGPNQSQMNPGATHYGDPAWEGGSAYPLSGQKWSFEEEGGMREPCVMRWPGVIPAGLVCSEVATGMDFFVTFAKLAGAAIPTDRVIDGKDIYPLMSGQSGAVSPYDAEGFFYGYPSADTSGKWILRSGKWKYKSIWNDDRLYDLSTDIGEKIEVQRSNPDVVTRLKTLTFNKNAEMVAHLRPLGNIKNYPDRIEHVPVRTPLTSSESGQGGWYYNLKGQRIPAAQASRLPSGIYFRKDAGGKLVRFLKP